MIRSRKYLGSVWKFLAVAEANKIDAIKEEPTPRGTATSGGSAAGGGDFIRFPKGWVSFAPEALSPLSARSGATAPQRLRAPKRKNSQRPPRGISRQSLALLLVSFSASAAVTDYTVGAGFRTLPWGAGVNVNVGKGLLMWGDPSPGNYRYGYLRPYARIQTSGVTNRLEAGFEIYPVAPVTLTIAQAYTHRNLTRIATLPCEGLECSGWLSRTMFSDRWMAGYGPLFYVGQYRMELLRPEVTARAFGDEGSNLAGAAGTDTLIGLTTILGTRIGENYRAGVYLDAARMRKTSSNNFIGLLFVRRDWTPYILTVSSGWYRSNFKEPGWTLLMNFEWQGGQSFALR